MGELYRIIHLTRHLCVREILRNGNAGHTYASKREFVLLSGYEISSLEIASSVTYDLDHHDATIDEISK